MKPEEVLKIWEWAKVFDFAGSSQRNYARSVMTLCVDYAQERIQGGFDRLEYKESYDNAHAWQSILDKTKEEG